MPGWVNGEEEFADLVDAEAAQLVRSYGSGAYSKAREALRLARDDGYAGLEKFYLKVTQAVAERRWNWRLPSLDCVVNTSIRAPFFSPRRSVDGTADRRAGALLRVGRFSRVTAV